MKIYKAFATDINWNGEDLKKRRKRIKSRLKKICRLSYIKVDNISLPVEVVGLGSYTFANATMYTVWSVVDPMITLKHLFCKGWFLEIGPLAE